MNTQPLFEADVIVVGAGAAGIGVYIALKDAGIADVLVIDRHGVGASFERWPKETRLLTPSFATNAIGMLDINSVAIGTSPAFSMQMEHPTGRDYACYLKALAHNFKVPLRDNMEITAITRASDGFILHTEQGTARARFVIWAGGEFQYPRTDLFPGLELCLHTAVLDSFTSITGDDVLIVGGYESGMDAAIHLARLGKNVTVLERDDPAPWDSESSDPSLSLSPYTLERLQSPLLTERITCVGGIDVTGVAHQDGEYTVYSNNGDLFCSRTPPILATGFRSSVSLVTDLFEQRADGYPLLTAQDESTRHPGLFICGPSVRHEDQVFCFIYKFRQRFGVVAATIAERLGVPAEKLEVYRRTYRQWGMYLDDLSCCGQQCTC